MIWANRTFSISSLASKATNKSKVVLASEGDDKKEEEEEEEEELDDLDRLEDDDDEEDDDAEPKGAAKELSHKVGVAIERDGHQSESCD